jgi:hypothetical protein
MTCGSLLPRRLARSARLSDSSCAGFEPRPLLRLRPASFKHALGNDDVSYAGDYPLASAAFEERNAIPHMRDLEGRRVFILGWIVKDHLGYPFARFAFVLARFSSLLLPLASEYAPRLESHVEIC